MLIKKRIIAWFAGIAVAVVVTAASVGVANSIISSLDMSSGQAIADCIGGGGNSGGSSGGDC